MIPRRLALVAVFVSLVASANAQEPPKAPTSFAPLLQKLWPEAEAKGISRKTFDQAFAGLIPDPRVAATTRKQPEYNSGIGTYVSVIASPTRISGATAK